MRGQVWFEQEFEAEGMKIMKQAELFLDYHNDPQVSRH
jgi:hypothetical protein